MSKTEDAEKIESEGTRAEESQIDGNTERQFLEKATGRAMAWESLFGGVQER